MNERKIQRIKRETAERISNRVRQLSPILSVQLQHEQSDFGLRREDIYWIPEIRVIITNGSAEEFEGLKSGLVGRLQTLVAGLKESRSTALLSLLPYENPSMEELSLATTWFKCEHCQCPPLRPKVAIAHGCFMQPYSGASESDREYMNFVGRTWALGAGISFYEKKAEFARELVLAAGGDPETMTHEDMDIYQCMFVHYAHPDVTIGSFDLMVRPVLCP